MPASNGGAIGSTLQQFESLLLARAGEMGLPRHAVVVGAPLRLVVLQGLEAAMIGLPMERRASATYLSKFIVAASAGLFDAALNYLWDETIGELRKRIIAYDLNYFFDNAASSLEKRKDLRDEEDLLKITDDELIRAAAKIGFISPSGLVQLDLVRYMRNHASAAHPNQLELQPLSLLGYMETCITQVIMLPESPTMVTTSRLLANVKKETVTREVAASFSTHFAGLRREQVETLANGLFGIYVSLDSTSVIRDNVRLLLPHLWPHIPEDARFNFGIRQARFHVNLDTEQATLAREFLQSVGGNSYLPEDARVADLDALLDRLRSAHYAMDNFYNEPPIARELESYVGGRDVPAGVRDKYVDTLLSCFLGRSSGISFAADPIYEGLLSQLNPTDAAYALSLIVSPEKSGLLRSPVPGQQFDRALALLSPKIVDPVARDLLAAVETFTGPKHGIGIDSRIERLREELEPLFR
ncbi:hypothetical protein LG314_09165 [Agrococcus terreus]|uniref:hypothetical protein n=1 Tax=Agrococcus terreus TaxID=574649 RepID=UPI00384F6C76